jgi:RNA polymerase sigma-70 factor (ECF subfamily)
MDEPELIRRAAGGDRAAFRRLVERYRTVVYRMALQHAGNHHDAEDVAQEVFLKLYAALPKFREEAQFSSWLYRITMNACIDHGRRRTVVRSREDSGAVVAEPSCGAPSPERRTYATEIERAVRLEIGHLPPRQRLIFVMRHYQELKLTDIAGALGLQEGTVKRQLHAATRRLRQRLQDALIDGRPL